MKLKKALALLATAMMVMMLVLTGCSSGSSGSDKTKASKNLNKSGFPIVKKKIKLTIVAPSTPTPDWNNVLVFNQYKKMTNIDVKWKMVSKDGLKEKTNLMLNSGDYPDAFHSAAFTAQDIAKYGEQGIFIPLNDLIDKYAPNLKKILEAYPDVKKGLTMPDGKIYSFPRIFDPNFKSVLSGWKLWINQDYLNKLGMKEPETLDDFYKYLKAVKEKDPNGNGKQDEIPLAVSGDETLIDIFEGSFGLRDRGVMNDYVDMDPKTNQLRFIPTNPNYKEMLEYLHKLYQEKLINQDMYTVKTEEVYARGSKGLFGAALTTNPDSAYGQKNFIGAPALKGPHGDAIYSNVKDPLVDLGGFVITNKDKDPAATVRWIDYFYSDEGSKLFFMGVKGKTYDEKPDGSVEYSDLITKNPDGLNYTDAISKYMTWRSGGYPGIVKADYFKGSEGLPSSIEAAKKFENNVPKKVWPTFNFTNDENEVISSIGTDIDNYIKEMDAKFITGKVSFDQWDKYVSTVKKIGLDKYMKVYNDAYKRYEKGK